MTKFFKKSLMILAVILIMLLSVSSIHAENGTDTGDVLTNDGDDVQIPIGNGTDSGNEGPDSGSGGVTPAGNGSGESGSETPSGNGTGETPAGNGTGETPAGNGTESGNGTGNGTGETPAGNGTESGNGTGNGTGETPAGNGTESGNGTGNGTGETPSGNGTESGNGTGNGTGETPSGNGTASGNGTGNGTGASAEVLTFSDLQRLINIGDSVITLNNSFKYDEAIDYQVLGYNGVDIKKSITLVGTNNCFIDGAGISRILWIRGGYTVTLKDITFKNGYANDKHTSHENGGAIYLAPDSTLTVKRCTFKNNRVYNANGAAIYANQDTKLYIYNSQFLDNKAERNSPLPWTSYKRGMGGTLLVGIDSTLKIENTDFKRNKAYVSVIVIASYDDTNYALSTATLKNCLFESNSAQTNGVFYLDELSKGYFTGCTFKSNTVTKSGSVLMLESSQYASVKDCNFEGNTAISGAINLGKFDGQVANFKNSVAHVTIEGTTFKNNKATESGGAIFSNSGILTIKKCTFDGNKADKSGGAIYADQYGTLKLYDTTFKNNYAKLYGGAIFAPIKTLSKVVDSNCVYKNNKAGKGAAHVYGVFSVKVSKVSSNYGSVVLKAKVSTPWKLLKTQKVGFKLVKGSKKYFSSVKKTNSKGEVVQKVPGKIKLGKYKAYAFSHEGTNYAKALSLTVTKAPCKVVLKKTTIKYKTSIVKAKLMNTKSKCIVSGAKLKVKVIGKWGSFSYIATASGDGIVKISTGKLSKGSYGLKITSADKNIKLKKFSAKIKIK